MDPYRSYQARFGCRPRSTVALFIVLSWALFANSACHKQRTRSFSHSGPGVTLQLQSVSDSESLLFVPIVLVSFQQSLDSLNKDSFAPRGKTLVVLHGDARSFMQSTNTQTLNIRSYARPGRIDILSTYFMGLESRERSREILATLTHEMVHLYMMEKREEPGFVGFPAWLHEGLARTMAKQPIVPLSPIRKTFCQEATPWKRARTIDYSVGHQIVEWIVQRYSLASLQRQIQKQAFEKPENARVFWQHLCQEFLDAHKTSSTPTS